MNVKVILQFSTFFNGELENKIPMYSILFIMKI
jgi:hypothetical protein